MVVAPATKSIASIASDSLALVLRRDSNGPKLAREPISHADLAEAFSEAWREGCLRKGRPEVALAEAAIRLLPQLSDDSASNCTGFALEVTPPGGTPFRREFSVRSLAHVARRMAEPLIASGALSRGHESVFQLVVDRFHRPTIEAEPAPFAMTTKSAPLTYLEVPLRPLLEQARAVDLIDDEVSPVFYTEDAFARAERCSRRGASANPPVETGGVLVGSLASCPASGEFFVVVTDVLEVQEADEQQFTLSYSSQSWTRIQTIVKARQAAHPEHAARLVGQAHGHNFLPLGGRICAECLKRPECSTRNNYASTDDQDWMRAVFARQPWNLCHIFGLSARGDRHHSLHGLQDGRWQSRGFFLLPDFKPEQWKPKNLAPKSAA